MPRQTAEESPLGAAMRKYSKNVKSLPRADLEGRYRNAFEKLVRQLNGLAEQAIEDWLVKPFMPVKNPSAEEEAELGLLYGKWIRTLEKDAWDGDESRFMADLKEGQDELLDWFILHGAGINVWYLDGGDGTAPEVEEGETCA